MTKVMIIHTVLLITLLLFTLQNNVFSQEQHAHSTKASRSITEMPSRIRPLGGDTFRVDVVKYDAGSNAVSSPSTSGRMGSLSFGTGLAFVSLNNAPLANVESFMYPISFTLGVSQDFDISLSVPYSYTQISSDNKIRGFGDLTFSISQSYMKQEDFGISVGFGYSFNIPTGSSDVVGENNDFDFTFSTNIERKWNSNCFNLSVSYTYQDLGKSDIDSVFGLGIALSRGFTDKFAASIELVTNDVRDDKGNYNSIFFVGTRLNLTDNETVSVLLGRNIDSSLINYISVMSYSYSF